MARIAIIGIVGKSLFFDVERFHAGGETIQAKSCHEEWGGKGFNQSVAVARQGAEAHFLGACGFGEKELIARAFADEDGLHLHLVEKKQGGTVAAIITDAVGETRVTCALGAALVADDVDAFADEIAAADMLVLGNEVPETVNLRASEIAEKCGTRMLMNPAPARPLAPEIKRRVAIFTPNEFEEEELGGVSGEIVTTLGAKGCRIRSTGETIPAAPCERVVDTTGAGDTFSGALAVRLAEGDGLPSACRFASAAAAKCVSVRYVIPSIPKCGQTPSDKSL